MRRLVLSVVLLSAPACNTLLDGAKEDFSNEFTCPKESVEARARKDIDDFLMKSWKPAQPSTEIAADPSRLKMFNQQQEERRGADNRRHWFEARGCGHQRLYSCGYTAGGFSSTGWICSKKDYFDGITKW
jgi:hypothetical protein